MPRIRRGRGSTHTGTSAPSRRATLMSRGIGKVEAVDPRQETQRRRRIRREPPPKPAATGRRLSQREAPELRDPGIAAASAVAALNTRLSVSRTGLRPRSSPRTLSESASARRKRQPIADVREHHQAVEQVIAVGAPAEHVRA